MIEAVELIIRDILANPERRKLSVVSMSLTGPQPTGSYMDKVLQRRIQTLLAMDVPMIVSAGNFAQKGGRNNVDTIPALFEGPNYPLIVAGSANFAGVPSVFSQGGPHIFVYAAGEDTTCLPAYGTAPLTNNDGTSYCKFSFSSYHPTTIPLTYPLFSHGHNRRRGCQPAFIRPSTIRYRDGQLVTNLRNYLSTDAGSWARNPNIRMVWNGVTETNNPKAAIASAQSAPPTSATTQSTPSPSVTQQCNGLASNKYVARDEMMDLIQNQFCPAAVEQGGLDKDSASIMRRYN